MIPTCVDPRRYPVARARAAEGRADLVWIGSSSTLRGLEQPGAIWNAVAAAVPGLRLRVICDRFPARLPDAGRRRPLGRGRRGPAARGRADRRELAAGRPLEPGQVRPEGPPVPGGRPARRGQPGRLPVRDDPARRERHPGRRRPPSGSTPSRRLAGDPELRRRMGAAGRASRRGGLFGLGLVRDLRRLDDRRQRPAAVAGSALEGRSARAAAADDRASSPTPPRSGHLRASNRLAHAMSICTPQDRTGTIASGPAGLGRRRSAPGVPLPAHVQAAGLGMVRIRRDRLVGPRGLGLARHPAGPGRAPARRMARGGLRLDRASRARTGSSTASSCPKGVIYIKHFLVPNLRAILRQWFRRGKGRNEGKRSAATGRDRRADDLADRAGRAAEAEVPVRELSGHPGDPRRHPARRVRRCSSSRAGPSRGGRASARSSPRRWAS